MDFSENERRQTSFVDGKWRQSNLNKQRRMIISSTYLGSEAAPYFSLYLLADFRLGSMGAAPEGRSPSQCNLQSLQMCVQMLADNAWYMNDWLSKWNTQEESINVLAPTALLGASAMLGDAILVQGSGSAQGNAGKVPRTKIFEILLCLFLLWRTIFWRFDTVCSLRFSVLGTRRVGTDPVFVDCGTGFMRKIENILHLKCEPQLFTCAGLRRTNIICGCATRTVLV